MAAEKYSFKVGKFECIALKDAMNAYENPANFLFCNVPKKELRQVLQKHEIELKSWNEWVSPLTCLLIKTGSHNVLIDTGVGSIFAPMEGELLRALAAAEVQPDQIDFVLITHAHGDHCGGIADSNGKAVFKNARYVMHKAEWDYWTAESTLAQPENEWMVPVVADQLEPLRDRFELIEKETEIVPGIAFITAPGHTPGHMIVRISADGDQLWYLSDTFLHPIHIEQPDWCASVDVQPEQAASMRHSLLPQLSAGRPLIHCFHFPFPGLGSISEKGDGYVWQHLTV